MTFFLWLFSFRTQVISYSFYFNHRTGKWFLFIWSACLDQWITNHMLRKRPIHYQIIWFSFAIGRYCVSRQFVEETIFCRLINIAIISGVKNHLLSQGAKKKKRIKPLLFFEYYIRFWILVWPGRYKSFVMIWLRSLSNIWNLSFMTSENKNHI